MIVLVEQMKLIVMVNPDEMPAVVMEFVKHQIFASASQIIVAMIVAFRSALV